MNQVLKLLFASCILLGVSAQASERPKVGLALSGGGARGAAHIGVLRELERQRIPIDYIAGTSMGAIVGGLYAAGNSTTRIEQILNEIDWKDIFRDQPERQYKTIRRKLDDSLFQLDKKIGVKNSKLQLPSGLIQGQKLQLLLDRLFASAAEVIHFDDLTVPFRAVATDIASGEAVVLEDKNLATAVRASMSVPSIFATVKINDFILVDGGISNNLPVDVVRDMGADVVIAVDIGTPLQPREKLQDIVGVSAQLSSLLVRNTTKRQLATLTEKDILIAPELGEFSAADFSSAAEIIVNGVTAARGAAAQLKPISIPSSEKYELVAVENNPDELYTVITAIRINNHTSLADEYIRNKLTQQLESELDLDQLEKDISGIYGLGILESVTYDVVPKEHGNELVLHVTEKPYGPRYLQFGLGFVSDFRKNNELTAIAGYTITPLNSWNGEWRTIMRLGEESGLITELYQPLSLNSKYFLNTSLFHRNQRFRTFEDGIIINEIRSKKLGGSIALGRELDRWGDLRLGITRFEVDDDLEFGIIDEPLEQYDGGEYSVSLRFDTLDDAYFPTTGVRGFLRFNSSDSDLGADNEFDQAQIDGLNVASWGKHTLFLGARFYSTIDGDAPVQSYFRTGGLFTLPGYIDNELSGTDLYLIRTGYQQKLSGIFGTSPYLGLTLQYGKIYQNSDEISLSDGITAGGLWLGWETPIGPVYLGYGRADTNNQSLYLSVGKFF